MIKFLILSLTDGCNLRCKYCYAGAKEMKNVLPLSLAKQALDLAAKDNERFKVQFSGGEPLLVFDRLKEIVEYARERELPADFQVQTNATLITEQMAEELKQLDIGIGVSLDGRPELNDRLRPLAGRGSSTALTVQGINNLKQAGLAAGLTCVISAENAEHLDEIVDLAYYLGNIRLIGFDLLRLHGRGKQLTAPDPDKVRSGLKKALLRQQHLEKLTGQKIIFRQLEQSKWRENSPECGFSHCYAMRGESLLLCPNGDLYPCGSLSGEQDFYLGSLKEAPDLKKMQDAEGKSSRWMEECYNCADFKLCGGGCFARFYWAGSHRYAAECALKKTFIDERKRKK